MRIDKQYKPELCVSKDVTRPHLADAHLSIEHKHVVATDGARLVMVPVEIEEGDTDGAITAEALKTARKEHKHLPEATIGATDGYLEVIGGGPTFRRPEQNDFPPYLKTIPDASGFHTFALDGGLFWEICQALGGKKNDCNIILHVDTTPKTEKNGIERGGHLEPIIIEKGGAFAVLMPVEL